MPSSFRHPLVIALLVLFSAGAVHAAEPAKKDESAKLDEYQVGGNKKVKKDDSAVAKVERPKAVVEGGFQMEKPAFEIAPMVVAPMQVSAPPPVTAAGLPQGGAAPAAAGTVAKPAAPKPAATSPKQQASPTGATAALPVAAQPAPTGAVPQAGSGGSAEPALVAISTPAPEYPREASMAGITGYVVVAFTLNSEGAPQDISIVESSPPRTFDQSARRAVARWRFQPVLVNGHPVERKVQRRIDFK